MAVLQIGYRERVGLSNSYLDGLQMPKVFLNGLMELLSEQIQEKWICWHGENNFYIWYLDVRNQGMEMDIYEGDSSFGLPLEGEVLKERVECVDIILEISIISDWFVLSVVQALKFYSYGDGYKI